VKPAKIRVLMGVYGVVACDGRVLRAAKALAETCDLILMGRASHMRCEELPFDVRHVQVPGFWGFKPARLLWFWIAWVWQAIRTRPEAIYACDFLMLLPGWLASRILRAKLVYDAHELIVPDQGRFRCLDHRIFYSIERLLVRRADLVIAANDARAAIMQTHYGLQRRPTAIYNIPPCLPEMQEDSAERKERLPPASGRIRLLYQGTMHLVREIDLFIRVLPYLGEQYELVMVGDGSHLDRLKEIAREEQVTSRVTFLGRVPNQDLPGVTRQCSIGIISYSFANPNQRHCAPNKVYEYAQAGIPVVATGQDTLRALVGDSGIGVVLSRGDTVDETLEKYADGIRYVAQHREQCIACIPEFLKNNNRDVEKARLKKCFEELLYGE